MLTSLRDFTVDSHSPFFLIAGPCVIESEASTIEIATELKQITKQLDIPFIFKASFDKANRSSHQSFRGPGLESGLATLEKIKKQLDIPVLTDVHEDTPIEAVAQVVDILQTPAFLCRQTNFIQRVARSGLPLNIKKGQFLAPWDMQHVVNKAKAVGGKHIMVCERGVMFGYNNLIVDMRSLAIMKATTSCPVVFDATHSVQLPGGAGSSSSGQRQFIPTLARAAIAVGIAGLFMETHPHPDQAMSDGPNSWPLSKMADLLAQLKTVDTLIKTQRAVL